MLIAETRLELWIYCLHLITTNTMLFKIEIFQLVIPSDWGMSDWGQCLVKIGLVLHTCQRTPHWGSHPPDDPITHEHMTLGGASNHPIFTIWPSNDPPSLQYVLFNWQTKHSGGILNFKPPENDLKDANKCYTSYSHSFKGIDINQTDLFKKQFPCCYVENVVARFH